MSTYTVILRECPDASRDAVGVFLGKAFSLKEQTCVAIAGASPIVLMSGLTDHECAVASVQLSGLERIGAKVEYTAADQPTLPKIDWPRRPQLFKRDLTEHVADAQVALPLPGHAPVPLIALLLERLTGQPAATEPSRPPSGRQEAKEFRGIQLPEITPFATPVLPASGSPPGGSPTHDDPVSRLNEMFPEDETGGFLPNNQDITSILDRLLPEDAQPAAAPSPQNGAPVAAGGGWAVFLAKIADEARRQKAVPVIAELAHLSTEEAEAMSKKVIIPVLKNTTKEDADAAKQRFAKIGILARVKGPEG